MLKTLSLIIFTSFLGLSQLSASEGVVNAVDYQKNSTLQWKWAMDSLESFLFDKCDKVLDIGCRNGSVTQEVAARVPSGLVIGLDISESMITYATEHSQAFNIIYMQGDPRTLPFIDQFDKAIALLTFNWIKEQESVLNSLYAALKPNGKAIITRPGKQPSNLGPVAAELIKTEFWAPYFTNFEPKKHYVTAEEYTLLLENAGFIIEKISQDSTYTYFKNKDALAGFFRPICNFIDHLTPALKEQFIEDVVEKVLESNKMLPDGSILLHDLKLEVIVSKP
ncbi:MAG TPA: methyltransferase domain-containing protein [Parachlamydiaceae bacterium]|nr:methyltransferase domain-containing protein [Parachlamydiaceae bacterium]